MAAQESGNSTPVPASDSSFDPDWWRGAMLYQIYPRSFQDSNDDGVGDLPGIIERLDYVKGLGVEGIWISPFFASPMADFGYDVSDYRKVDPIFGNNDDADRLIAEAEKRGLPVIVDMVMSHTSDRHKWFEESASSRDNPKADWYVWADPELGEDGERQPPNNWKSVFGGSSWQWHEGRQQYYLHNFDKAQPDLNMHNPKVQEAMLGEVEYWLKKGVKGLRLDAINFLCHDLELRDCPVKSGTAGNSYSELEHIYDKNRPETLDFIRRLRKLTDQYPGAFMVGEIGDDNGMGIAKSYTNGDDLLHTAYNFSLFDRSLSAGYIKGVFEYYDGLPGDGYASWAISNHDVPRAASRWGGPDPDPARAKQLNALLALLPGTVFMYQGEELGLPDAPIPEDRRVDPAAERGSLMEGRDPSRVPMPWEKDANQAGFSTADDSWLPIPESYHERAVSVQDPDPDSTLNYTRRVNAWRKANRDLADAPIEFYQKLDEPLLAFKRGKGDNQVTALFNTTGDELTYKISNYDLVEDITGNRLLGPGEFVEVTLPPYGMLVKSGKDKAPFPLPSGDQGRWLKTDGKPLLPESSGPNPNWGMTAKRLLGDTGEQRLPKLPVPPNAKPAAPGAGGLRL